MSATITESMSDYLLRKGLVNPENMLFLTTDPKGRIDFLVTLPPRQGSPELMKKLANVWFDHLKKEESFKFWSRFPPIPNKDLGLPRVSRPKLEAVS